MLWDSTSWSRLKLTVQIQLVLHLWEPFLINNRKMTGNSVENKKCCCVECKTTSKTYIQNVLLTLKPVIYSFRTEHHFQHGLLRSRFLRILAIPCNLQTGNESLKPCIDRWRRWTLEIPTSWAGLYNIITPMESQKLS